MPLIKGTLTMAMVALTGLAGTPPAVASEHHGGLRLPFESTVNVTGKVVLPDPADPVYAQYASRCAGGQAPVVIYQGAGDSPDLGLFTDVQSHCLGQPVPDPADPTKVDLSFFNGVFVFTALNGRTVTGKYMGLLRPTDTAVPPTSAASPPSGGWIIEGRVCIGGGTLFRNIVDDCTAGRWFDARGTTVLDPLTGNNNPATLFLRQTIGILP